MASTVNPSLMEQLSPTDRRQQQQQERFGQVFDNAGAGLALIDLHGRFLEVNDAFCRTSQRSRGRLTRETIADLTAPDDLHAHLEHLRRLVAGDITGYRLATHYTPEDGAQVPVVLTATLAHKANGAPVQVLGVRVV
jgi:PAS domain S-box-containing protein